MANFREMARQHLARAKAELASNNPDRLRYTALEVRFAMETITYDRAYAYKDEIPPQEYSTWQPRQVLDYLTQIDPNAALTSTISVGREETYGVAPQRMTMIGTDVVLTIQDLKKHYNAIGAYLHPPTLDKINDPSAHDPARLRQRCEDCIGILERVLSSPVWNVTLGAFSEMTCERCGKLVRRRLNPNGKPAAAECFECGAAYTVEQTSDNVAWRPDVIREPCPSQGCLEKATLWRDEVKPGTHWTCHGCGKSYEITLGIVPKATP
jgi:hypothetical protein